MACSGSYCNSYGTGTTTCAGHRAACSVNRPYTGTSDLGTTSQLIRSGDVDTLRTSIMAELDSFNNWQTLNSQPPYFKNNPGTISAGLSIANTHINNLRSTVDQLRGTGQSDQFVGQPISAPVWAAVLSSYNLIRQDCICNSDCACNAVCACHNNCDCNYSDIRLKENIELVRFEHGLNIYTWNYIWDKAKRYIGVMAQEVLNTNFSHAVNTDINGYYIVNYCLLPITMEEVK
jgi:hypothetical protein